jgi:hypothetical protein
LVLHASSGKRLVCSLAWNRAYGAVFIYGFSMDTVWFRPPSHGVEVEVGMGSFIFGPIFLFCTGRDRG